VSPAQQRTSMRRVVLVVGPTAVGKTDVAAALADRLGGPRRVRLISADSAMVYRGMNIGSAKPTAAELAMHPHELIDIRDPEETYTAADFVADADACVASAFEQGQVPILVGGTMLYVKRFLEGIADLPEADLDLRASLVREFEQRGGAVLHAELAEIDAAAARNIHPHNAQRLLRAIEVVRLTGRPLSDQWQELNSPPAVERLAAEIMTFAILPDDRRALHERIANRFDLMLAAGFEGELIELSERPGVTAELPSMRAVGYRQGLQYLRGELDAAEFRDKAITATRRLAKRQLTWLRSWRDVNELYWGDAGTLAAQIQRQLEA